MSKRVLIVDDEASIRKLLQYNIEKEGYEVTTAADGEEGYQLAATGDYDFIILDLMLPKMDGMDVCKHLRQDKIDTPILMLTAKDDELEKIIGLEIGADDYMTKPFSPREVLARMKAILRRYDKQKQPREQEAVQSSNGVVVTPGVEDKDAEIIHVGDIIINTEDYTVNVRGKDVDMTPKEFELLTYMAKRVNRTLSRERLLQKIWDFDYTDGTRIVDVHISHLREKIEKDTKNPEYIITVRGFGYKFEVPKSCKN